MDGSARAPGDTERLLRQIAAGDARALEELLARERPFVRRVIEVRMDQRMRGRVDPSDVVQESLMEATRRIAEYLERRPMPFRLWVRQTAFENLLRLRRFHLEAGCRAADRESPLDQDSSVTLGRQLLANGPGPLRQLLDRELAQRVRDSMAQLPETDREVLLMRCFEGLTNQEVAQALGLELSAASHRFGRALLRLRKQLTSSDITDADHDRSGA